MLTERFRNDHAMPELFLICLIACAGITIKITGALMMGGIIISLATFSVLYSNRKLVLFGVISCIFMIAFVPWAVVSVIKTGYPLYPSQLLPISVEWRPPEHSVELVVKEYSDFLEWNMKIIKDIILAKVDFVGPAFISVIMSVWCVKAILTRQSSTYVPFAIFFPILLQLPFLMIFPDYRYISPIIWTLAATITALGLPAQPNFIKRLTALFVLLVCAGAVASKCLQKPSTEQDIFHKPVFNYAGTLRGFHPPATDINWHAFDTEFGLELYVADYSWRAPINYSRVDNPKLALRHPGDFSSGFIIHGGPEGFQFWESQLQLGYAPRDGGKPLSSSCGSIVGVAPSSTPSPSCNVIDHDGQTRTQ
jgi:hypothetical protein